MDFYRGKHCLITGGSSGIGLAAARQLAKSGANVWILAFDPVKLENALASIKAEAISSDQQFGTLQADISNEQEVIDVVWAHIVKNGVPDILINSAGVARPGYIDELPMDVYHWMMDVNYFGTVHVTKVVAPEMARRGSGVIVNISSVAGFAAVIADSAYSASKFAVRGFSDALRIEMKPKGVKVVIVYPPDTDTPQLAYENQFKPPVLAELSKNAGIQTADAVAQAILKGVAKGRKAITPGMETTAMFWLLNHVGNYLYPIMDYMVNQAEKSVEKQRSNGSSSSSR